MAVGEEVVRVFSVEFEGLAYVGPADRARGQAFVIGVAPLEEEAKEEERREEEEEGGKEERRGRGG